MNTLSAFTMGEANRGKPEMVFDWDKAARLIAERKPKTAEAGLCGDWEWTGGVIYENGKPVRDRYTYLASTWATPQIEIDGEQIDCFLMAPDSPGWSENTKWPESAIAILESEVSQ